MLLQLKNTRKLLETHDDLHICLQNIKVLKDSDQLGVQVDIEEGGINGLVVRSVAPGGTVGRDARIQVCLLHKTFRYLIDAPR